MGFPFLFRSVILRQSINPLSRLAALSLVIAIPAPAAEPSEEGEALFAKIVQPLLTERCYKCHSVDAEKVKGELLLDSRVTALKGGESGAGFVPSEPERSQIVEAIRWTDKDLQMPPKTKLSDSEIADVERWIRMGAPWPGGDEPAVARKESKMNERARTHWSFQPVKDCEPPGEGNAIDAFLDARMKEKGLSRNPAASPRMLLRRSYFDLIGLPPSPEEIRDFERDPSLEHYTRIVNDLLARPQYGER